MSIYEKAMDADTPLPLFGLVFGIGIVIMLAVMPFFYLGNKISCEQAYQNYQPQYGFWSGCRIMWEGKLTPTDMIKNININQ